MKRLLLALVILGCGSTGLVALHRSTGRLRVGIEQTSTMLSTETQHVTQMRLQLQSASERVRQLEHKIASAEGGEPASRRDGGEELPAGSAHLSPEQSERLLAQLGFNWGTSGDYVIVSKDTLHAVYLEGIRGRNLGQGAVQVLAITPEERSRVETTLQQVMADYDAWVLAHAQRTEPNGDVVAKYSLPASSDFSLSLSNSFAAGVFGVLGSERGNLLLDYSRSWIQDLGMGGTGGENSFTVKRYPGSTEPHYSFEVRYSGNIMSTDVSPYQNFPAAFLPLFPNGWPDLARREGFELPKEFKKF